jgi:hypothetical protein
MTKARPASFFGSNLCLLGGYLWLVSSCLEIPTVHMLILCMEADAKEVVEDPHHRQSRYCQHHPEDAEECPAYYHGQQDRDRVDVERPSVDARHEVVALHLLFVELLFPDVG